MKFKTEKFAYTGLSSQQATTTLFTPAADGDFLITIYAEIVTDSSAGGASTNVQLIWTDDIQAQSGYFANTNPLGGHAQASVVIHAKSGQPVQWSDSLNDNTHSGSAPGVSYNVFFLAIGLE